MNNPQLITVDKSVAIRGVCALSIFVFHILLGVSSSPLLHFWGGMFVAVFLILSGYGINESFRRHGLKGYWHKRLNKVIVPTIVFMSGFDLLAPHIGFHTWWNELTYSQPTYWFVFHIAKCYAAYWVARHCCGRYWLWALAAWGVYSLNHCFCGMHLESEQCFSFLAGVLFSEYGTTISRLSRRGKRISLIVLFVIGLGFFAAKSLPELHQYIGTVAYNYLLFPFRLSWGVVATFVMASWPIERSRVLAFCGRRSLEIYIAHMPLLPLMHGVEHVPEFVALSLLAFALLYIYVRWVQPRLTVGVALYVVVNALFVAKYGSRLLPSGYEWIVAGYVVAQYAFAMHLLPLILRHEKACTVCLLCLACCFVGMVFVQYHVDPYLINVDRWSTLHYPIQNLLQGVYPYIAQTHLGGNASPFPVWQVFHIPFYLMGNVGLSFFFALVVFWWSVFRQWGWLSFVSVAMLMVVSPAVWYEVAVRSDFITNMMLVATVINLCIGRLSADWLNRHIIIVGVVAGLMGSTRLVALIPLGMMLLPYCWQLRVGRRWLLVGVTAAAFVATFVPFALWDWDNFFHHHNNPWSLQTRQGHIVDFLLFIPLGIWLSLRWKGDVARYFVCAAAMLFVFVAVALMHRMTDIELWDIFASPYDITYFTSVQPFAVVGYSVARCGCLEGDDA